MNRDEGAGVPSTAWRAALLKGLLLAGVLSAFPGRPPAFATVRIVVGPTPIPHGDARSGGDITVVNEKLAFALAVESPVPYGVPRGAIVDVAPVINGRIGRDRVVFADFIPNNWSAWPNTHRQVDILERGPDRVVIRAIRDWGKATIKTVYTLKSGADAIEIETTLTNDGDAALSDLFSGMTLWPGSGYLFSVPGLSAPGLEAAAGALTDRVVAYGEDWFVSLHAPYFDHAGYGSKDMFRRHSLGPGQSVSFDAELQVGTSGDLAPVLANEIRRKHLDSGVISGDVTGRDGKLIAHPVIVIEKEGHPFAWTIGASGHYVLRLPAGTYSVYATARNHSRSEPRTLAITAGSNEIRHFSGLEPPGRMHMAVISRMDQRALDARIEITSGPQPAVGFLGRRTFFTELGQRGVADMAMTPGEYVFTVSSGGGFTSPRQTIPLTVHSGHTTSARVAVPVAYDPEAHGWYCADLHHHADQAEAVTPPADVARSQLAAGLDMLFVSDHDSTVNEAPMLKIARQRRIGFIPGIELSPSWGHFNAYPLRPDARLAIDTGTADVHAVLAEARRLGATVVQANHPFNPFGYLTSVAAGVAPGGFDPSFDLLEINSAEGGDDRVLAALHQYWTAGHRYYLTAGTDTHDVWKDETGRVRVYVHVDGAVTAASFVQSLKNGHAYVSFGPLIEPSAMFGDTLKVAAERPFALSFTLRSVTGLAEATLMGSDGIVESRKFAAPPHAAEHEARVDFQLKAPASAWYSIIVVDTAGKRAYSNPIWMDVTRP